MRTFDAALPADATRQIHNFNRRLRYRQRLDRPKVWPGDPVHGSALFYRQPESVIAGWCAMLVEPPSTAAYISSWCRLNHLLDGLTMQRIHATPTYVLEADFTHDAQRDIHTLDLYQTWPTMAKPYRCRVAQFNLPRAALLRLAQAISENANGPA